METGLRDQMSSHFLSDISHFLCSVFVIEGPVFGRCLVSLLERVGAESTRAEEKWVSGTPGSTYRSARVPNCPVCPGCGISVLKRGQSQANRGKLDTLELAGAVGKLAVGPRAPVTSSASPPQPSHMSFLKIAIPIWYLTKLRSCSIFSLRA